MAKFQGKYRSNSNRCKYWDYSMPGRYFLTLCIQNMECILGHVHDNKVILSVCGKVVKSEVLSLPQYNRRLILHEWVVMPNHIHLLLELGNWEHDNGIAVSTIEDENIKRKSEDESRKPHRQKEKNSPTTQNDTFYLKKYYDRGELPWWYYQDYNPTVEEIREYNRYLRRMLIPKVMGEIKMITSKQMNILRETPGRKNWQSDYYDRVIRSDQGFHRIKTYIRNNPRDWGGDEFHGGGGRSDS